MGPPPRAPRCLPFHCMVPGISRVDSTNNLFLLSLTTLSPCHLGAAMDDNKDEKEPRGGRGPIIDRRIEASGLSTFASNLNRPRRTSPPSLPPPAVPSFQAPSRRQRGTSTTPSGSEAPSSVRAIVDWLESTKATPQEPPPKSGDGSDSGPHYHLPPAASPQPASSPPSIGGPTEAYSLTLLKYKAYFNNRPLGRCLDDCLKTSTLPPELRVALEPGAEADDDGRDGEAGTRAGDSNQPHESQEATPCCPRGAEDDVWRSRTPPPRHTKSDSVHRLEELMQELADLAASEPPLCIKDDPPTRTPPRPPREARTFWDGVRRYLHIPDDYLDGPAPPPSHGTTPPISAPPSETEAFPALLPLALVDARLDAHQQGDTASPHRSRGGASRMSRKASASTARSASRPHQPSTASQSTSGGGGGGGGHLRRLTTEEKMSEIDAFLYERPPTLALSKSDPERCEWRGGISDGE